MGVSEREYAETFPRWRRYLLGEHFRRRKMHG